MLKKNIAVLIILFSAAASALSAENPFPLPPSALSAGYSGGSFSSMINPVFSDLDSAEDIAYRYLFYDIEDNGNHFASINLFGFDLIYSRYNTIPGIDERSIADAGVNVYSINKGFFFNNTFGFGAGFSISSSADDSLDGYKGWNAGLLYRPFSFISFGGVLRDLNASISGDKIDYSAVYSISIRPWKEYLTLSADCVKKKNEDAEFCYSGELKGFRDISLIVKYGTDKSITAGLTLPFSVRDGGCAEIAVDAYGSAKSDASDFRSGGIAINLKRNRDSAQMAFSQNLVYLKISSNYASEREDADFFSKREPVFQDLTAGIQKAGNDPTINGFVIEIDNAGFGFAQIEEVRDLLNGLRARGKKVYAILNYPGNKEYYLATAADKIYFTPNSTFKLTGLSIKAYFLKGLLDRGGVKYESFSRGRYKSFNEMFTRKEMSVEARENLTSVLSELNEQFIAGIIEGRKLTRSAVEEMFRRGSYSPIEAKEKGFVDDIMYAGDAIESIEKTARTVSFEKYIREDEQVTSWGTVPVIAVINVTGSIISGKGGGSAVSGTTGDYEYGKSIDAAFGDPSVKAVVVRINSGGGSAAASDYMWEALYSAKKKNPKPVVFSFGNTAASGGYYISCTGDTIFAGKGTITGSIGVVAGKISVVELYSKLGISTETIRTSEFADIFSESRSLTQSEKKLFQKEIDFIYDRFTGKVIEGRKIPEKDLPEVAEGRIHTGSAAKGKKLIDETGGLIAAIEYAKVKGGIDSSFRIVNLPETRSLLTGLLGGSGVFSFHKYLKFLAQNIEKYRMLEERTLYIEPYTIEIE